MIRLLTKPFDCISAVLRTSFVRSVSTLAGGTLGAQLLLFLISPIITRLYSPDDFGLLAVYTSSLGLLSSVSTLRYDQAIPLPKEEEDATALLCLSLLSTGIVSSLVAVTILGFNGKITEALNAEALSSHLWMLPVGLGLIGVYTSFNSFAIRQGAFGRVARTRVRQAVTNASTQIGLGLLQVGAAGLLIGSMLGQSAGISTLSRGIWKRLSSITRARVLTVAIRYKRFPLVTSLSDVINTAGLNAPVLLVSSLFGAGAAGSLLLAQRVIGVPVSLLSGATAQVYVNRAAELRRTLPSKLSDVFVRTAVGLAAFGGLPVALVGWIGVYLVPIVFGAEWLDAALMMRPLCIMYAFQVVVSPLTHTLGVILERQVVQLFWDVARLLVVLATFFVGANSGYDVHAVMSYYSIAMCVMYAVYLVVAWLFVRRASRYLDRRSRRGQ